jgi:hypothetical protein
MPTADLGLTPGQLTHAQQIVAIGKKRGMSQRDIVTALTVALDESGLQNYANTSIPQSMSIPHEAVGHDHASVGVFQQQVGIWGTASELMNPATAAGKFYDALAAVKTRSTMTIAQAAQTVQQSATSDGSNYAAHEAHAQEIYNTITRGVPGAGLDVTTDNTPSGGTNALVWLSTPDNWKRIGVFALGGFLVGFVAWTLLVESDVMKKAIHVAGKVV